MIQSNWAIGSSHVAGWPGDWPGWLSYGHLPNLVLDFDQFWPIAMLYRDLVGKTR